MIQMPGIDFPFGRKPIGEIASGLMIPARPELVGTSGDLFFEAKASIHSQHGTVSL